MSKAVEEAVVEVEIDAMELLTALVDEHKASFAASNPACKRAFEERGAAGLPGGTNRPSIYFEPFPLTFVGSKGGHLTTADGKELVDMQGNMTAGRETSGEGRHGRGLVTRRAQRERGKGGGRVHPALPMLRHGQVLQHRHRGHDVRDQHRASRVRQAKGPHV
jgi:hypothetical protein